MPTTQGNFDELRGYYLEELSVGMTALYARTITEADVVLFAGISGDVNPVHLNQDFAAATIFGGRIAHGMLTASLLSTVIGTKLPGPGCIYVSQNLRFKAPVRSGDTVQARATITEIIPEKRRVVLTTVCSVGDKVVIDGEAVIMVPRAPAAGDQNAKNSAAAPAPA
ncbi:MAG: MaoC family dehydratase [Rhodospirillaceae bacterium]|nr:MaoC family dehydratase [Rhodospirillaceae bacterium]